MKHYKLRSVFVECENFYLPRKFLWSFDRWYTSNRCFNKALENFLKLENSPLKISTSLSNPSRTTYCDVKSISFPTKPPSRRNKARILTARTFDGFETSCIKSPGGGPRNREPEQMPRGCPGGMGTGGIDWCKKEVWKKLDTRATRLLFLPKTEIKIK